MKIKKKRFIDLLCRQAERLNEAFLNEDTDENRRAYGALLALSELYEWRVEFSFTVHDNFVTAKWISVDSKTVFKSAKETVRAEYRKAFRKAFQGLFNTDHSKELTYDARQTIANEVSQFLQDAGFEEASKAVDCEFEL